MTNVIILGRNCAFRAQITLKPCTLNSNSKWIYWGRQVVGGGLVYLHLSTSTQWRRITTGMQPTVDSNIDLSVMHMKGERSNEIVAFK